MQFNDAPLMNEYQKKACALFGGISSRISNPEAIFTLVVKKAKEMNLFGE